MRFVSKVLATAVVIAGLATALGFGFGLGSNPVVETVAQQPAEQNPAEPTSTDSPFPKLGQLRADRNGKVTVAVIRPYDPQPFRVGGSVGRVEGIAPKIEIANGYRNVELYDLKGLTITTAGGKPVAKEEVLRRIGSGEVFVMSADGKKISPEFLKVFKDDVLVLVSPELVSRPKDAYAEAQEEAHQSQLDFATEAFAKLGAIRLPGSATFQMPNGTTDNDLRFLPSYLKAPPFPGFQFGLQLENTEVTDGGLKELKNVSGLTGLSIGGRQVTDKGIQELQDLKELSHLTLIGGANGKLSDAGIKELKELKNLTELNLWELTTITDVRLREIKNLTKLTTLSIMNAERVTAVGLKELSQLKNLQSLDLPCAVVTDEGLEYLRGLKNLERLNLSRTRITNAGIKQLSFLTNLRRLYLAQTRMTNAGVAELKDFQNLEELDLSYTDITGKGLKELKNLKRLFIAKANLTTVGLKDVGQLKHLNRLDLGFNPITDAGLEELTGLQELTDLDLTGCGALTDVGVNALREALPKCQIKHR